MSVNWDVNAEIRAVHDAAMQGVVAGAESVLAEAINMILTDPKTGRVYIRRGVAHQASSPGEAPANDTGRLAQSGRTEAAPQELAAAVIFSTEYAAALEYGTPRILPRPYATPALMKKAEEIQTDIDRRVALALEKRK